MITRDFHGYSLLEAEREIDDLVGMVRSQRARKSAEFITGRGVIRIAVMQRLKEYKIESHYQIANDGVVLATIE